MPSVTTLPICHSPTLAHHAHIAFTVTPDGEHGSACDTADANAIENGNATDVSTGAQEEAPLIRKSLHNWIRLKEAVRTYSSHSIPDLAPTSSSDFSPITDESPAIIDDVETEEREDDDTDTDENIYTLGFDQTPSLMTGGANLPAAANQRHNRALELFRFRGLVRQKTEAQKLERVLEKWLSRRFRPLSDGAAVGHEDGGQAGGTGKVIGRGVGKNEGVAGGGKNAETASRRAPRFWRKKSKRRLLSTQDDPTVLESSSPLSAATYVFSKAKKNSSPALSDCENLSISPHEPLAEASSGNTVQTTDIESLVMVLRRWRTNVPLPYMHEVLGELGRMFYENRVAGMWRNLCRIII